MSKASGSGQVRFSSNSGNTSKDIDGIENPLALARGDSLSENNVKLEPTSQAEELEAKERQVKEPARHKLLYRLKKHQLKKHNQQDNSARLD